MRIGLDAYPLTRGIKAGISYYTHHMVRNILDIDNKNEYFLYTPLSRKVDLSYPNLHFPPISDANLVNKFSTSWMLFNAKRRLNKDKIDIFWGTQGIIPPNLPESVRSLVTIHDLTFYLYPRSMAFINYLIHKFLLKKSIVNAQKIIADSYATANDLKNIFENENIKEKTSVVYCGIDSKFKQSDKALTIEYLVPKFNISRKFILYVGTVEPRKNIVGLLKAFKILKTKYMIPHQLLLVGPKGWKTAQIIKIYRKFSFRENDVKFLGYVGENDLVRLYGGADLFVIPSFYEGFGMPPLEAMGCGLPVVASNIAIFREVLGEAALLVDPLNSGEIAECIYKVLSDNELKIGLVQKGFKRSKMFSWKSSAEKMLEAFDSIKPEYSRMP